MGDLITMPLQHTEQVFKMLFRIHGWNEPKDYEAFRLANPQHNLPDVETVLKAFEGKKWKW